jgi:lambda family phage portal protein
MSAVIDFVKVVADKVAPPRPTTEVRRYDAASKTARMSGWLTPATDANAAIIHTATIRNRARDLVRNNSWAAKGVNVIVNNSVGYGIRAQLKAGSQLRTRQAQALWQRHMETSAIDADGMLDFYGLQALAMRCLVESGEVLIRMRPRRLEDNLPLPFQIQILEPDLLADEDTLTPETGNSIHNGIEFDALGRRVAYHLYRRHPGDFSVNMLRWMAETTRVPASEIIHLYRKDRPGQDRGVSWLAPAVRTLYDLGLYDDGTLKRVQLSALFAGFISSDDPQAFGDELESELPDLQPGTMYLLKPGQNVQFNSPPPANDDPAFREWILRSVASGLGITYEALTGNLSTVNFSSARMGHHDMGRNIDAWQWNLFIPVFCGGVFGWFKEMIGASPEYAGFKIDDMSVEWTPPARTVVDPAKEWKALQTAVRSGFISLPEAIRSQGYDPDSVLAEQAEYLAKLDAAGLKVESDYRQDVPTPSGLPDDNEEATDANP